MRERTEELEAVFQAWPDLLFHLDKDGTILDYRAQTESKLYTAPDQFYWQKNTECTACQYVVIKLKKPLAELLESDKDISIHSL